MTTNRKGKDDKASKAVQYKYRRGWKIRCLISSWIVVRSFPQAVHQVQLIQSFRSGHHKWVYLPAFNHCCWATLYLSVSCNKVSWRIIALWWNALDSRWPFNHTCLICKRLVVALVLLPSVGLYFCALLQIFMKDCSLWI